MRKPREISKDVQLLAVMGAGADPTTGQSVFQRHTLAH